MGGRQELIFKVSHRFIWIYIDLDGISVILGLGCRDPLWRAVAPCGALWRPAAESCGPYILPCSVLGACRLAGWCLAGWLDGWMAGWRADWMAGWLDGRHHSCNLARLSSRRVGGSGICREYSLSYNCIPFAAIRTDLLRFTGICRYFVLF